MHQYVSKCNLSDQSNNKWVQLMFQDGHMVLVHLISHSQLSMNKIHFSPTFPVLPTKMPNF